MEIKIGEVYKNKTWNYLAPCLRGHGVVFINKFNIVFKLAIGVHDEYTKDTQLADGRNVYVLIDKLHRPDKFKDFMKYVKQQEYYKGDYCPDANITTSRKHMVVVTLPERFNSAYDYFLAGEYSKMYTKKELEILFSPKSRIEQYNVMSKAEISKANFARTLSEEFQVSETEVDTGGELELPLKRKEEFFNVTSKEPVFFNPLTDKYWNNE